MDKTRMESPDLIQRNIEAIGALFPNCITETRGADGAIRRAINFDMLRQMLTDEAIAGDEVFEFTWVGKKQAIVEASRPIRKTLRPCISESRDWDNTQNLYIEGDNLDVLKLLQESYLGKVKMIYIDPPYNTGHDFVYRDSFARSQAEEEMQMGMFDDETDDRLFENTESNGRFHSDWCSMLYPRLLLARNLLADGGFIFISIDENEEVNLKSICNEIFGREYFLGSFIWHRRQMPDSRNQSRYSMDHEYVLCYTKGNSVLKGRDIDRGKYQNPDNDPRGPWFSADLTGLADKEHRPNLHYDVVDPTTGIVYPPNPTRGWCCSRETFAELIAQDRILWPSKPDGRPRRKKFLSEVDKLQTSFSSMLDVGYTTEGTRALQSLFDGKVFDFPKPVSLIKAFVEQSTGGNDIILDFFSGSATTAEAVFEQNVADGSNRRFILVQLPEKATNPGFQTICDIGKERIRRAGDKIKVDAGLMAQGLDIGFRVLKLADSNMKSVYLGASEYTQNLLNSLISNIQEDRTDLDLLFGCLLDWGLPLSLPLTTEEIAGCSVHTYNGGDLIVCFENNMPETVIREIASRHPLRAVFRDSSFASSPERINVEEIFKLLSPNTSVKVL